MIYILIGEMGTGKNYVGEQLAEFLNCEFFDGDTVIPASMARKVQNFKPLSLEDIDHYVAGHLLPAIKKRSQGSHLVVAQALYRQNHRDVLQAVLGPDQVQFVHIKAPSIFTHMRRLLSRDNGVRWALFGLFNKLFFQKPRGIAEYVNTHGPMDESDYYRII